MAGSPGLGMGESLRCPGTGTGGLFTCQCFAHPEPGYAGCSWLPWRGADWEGPLPSLEPPTGVGVLERVSAATGEVREG